MPTTTTDAQLVAAHLSGDRAALAAIYDRYGATLYDTARAMTRSSHDADDVAQDVFVAAAERMAQLRDPTRLKPWLFAILRNEVYRRTGKKQKVVATDFTEPVAEMNLPTDSADETENLEYQELAELVRNAAFGLDERDRLVLEYSVRQGLEGEDLADALGVTAQQSYGLVHRMRQRTERSLGAYCVARKGRKNCDELAKILDGWDGEFSILIRKRVARHIDGCDTCERSRRTIAPLALFGAAPAFAAPPGLRDRVLAAAGQGGTPPPYEFAAPGGFPTVVAVARRLGLWIALSTVAFLFVGGTTAWVLADGGDQLAIGDSSTTTTEPGTTTTGVSSTAPTSTTIEPSTTVGATTTTEPLIVVTLPSTSTTTSTTSTTTTTTTTTTVPATTTVPPGALGLSAGAIDFGRTLDSASVRLSNTGGRAVDWSTAFGPAGFMAVEHPFSVSPSSGSLAPGASVDVMVVFDRKWPEEGPVDTTQLQFVATGTSAAVDLDGVIGRRPTVRVISPTAQHCVIQPIVAAAVVDDESAVTVDWIVESPTATETFPMTFARSQWRASTDTDMNDDNNPDVGTYSWSIVATDAFGNQTIVTGETDVQTSWC